MTDGALPNGSLILESHWFVVKNVPSLDTAAGADKVTTWLTVCTRPSVYLIVTRTLPHAEELGVKAYLFVAVAINVKAPTGLDVIDKTFELCCKNSWAVTSYWESKIVREEWIVKWVKMIDTNNRQRDVMRIKYFKHLSIDCCRKEFSIEDRNKKSCYIPEGWCNQEYQ